MKSLTIKGILRHYWNKEENHNPYRAMTKEIDDKTDLHFNNELDDFMSSAKDGSIFEVKIIIKDVAKVTKGYIWKNTKPHTYSRVKVKE